MHLTKPSFSILPSNTTHGTGFPSVRGFRTINVDAQYCTTATPNKNVVIGTNFPT